MRRTTLSRGFTLVELMVAVTGGLFVTIAVFMLAKQSTGLYRSEARISNATVSSVVGFERLRTDIARSGFLATPNAQQDPRYCGQPTVAVPMLFNLAPVSILRVPSATVPAALTANGIAPDQIILSGSYTTTDQFPIAVLDANVITLQTNSPAMARLGGVSAALLQSVFKVGSALRIMDGTGKIQFGIVQAVGVAGALPQITLAGVPSILRREGSPYKCGVAGEGAGAMVSPVNFIRYSLQEVAANPLFASFAPIAADPSAPPTDAGRTELVREELNPFGVPIAGTQEIVAEFAVDLAFGITIANNAAAGVPQLQSFAPGANEIAQWAGTPAALITTPNQGPQRVRSVRARLSIRSREADRTGNIPAAQGLYRFGVGANGTGPFARVRTVEADIALRNSRDSSW